MDGRTRQTVSIINDHTFTDANSVKQSRYQQFRIQDPEYASFVDTVHYVQPTQVQLDEFQQSMLLYPSGFLDDDQLFRAYSRTPGTVVMTVSRAVAERVNNFVTSRLFGETAPSAMCPAPPCPEGQTSSLTGE